MRTPVERETALIFAAAILMQDVVHNKALDCPARDKIREAALTLKEMADEITRQEKINKVSRFCAATDCGNCKAEHMCVDVGYGTMFFHWSEASETMLDAMLAAIDAAKTSLFDEEGML